MVQEISTGLQRHVCQIDPSYKSKEKLGAGCGPGMFNGLFEGLAILFGVCVVGAAGLGAFVGHIAVGTIVVPQALVIGAIGVFVGLLIGYINHNYTLQNPFVYHGNQG